MLTSCRSLSSLLRADGENAFALGDASREPRTAQTTAANLMVGLDFGWDRRIGAPESG